MHPSCLTLNHRNAKLVFQVTTSSHQKETYDFALSTLYAPLTARLLPENTSQTLLTIPAVSVMVVNLFFGTPLLLHPISGFGYLLPKSLPHSQNPERALGVIFDSDAVPNQDSRPGTKLTVILGGHWWSNTTTYPSDAEGVTLARSVIERQLHVKEAPIASHVSL